MQWAETLTDLTKSFNWSDELKKKLAETPMESLEDFRFYWTAEPEITAWFTTHVGKFQNDTLQMARLKRAWVAIRKQGELRDADKSQSQVVDMDEMLDADTLHERKMAFWVRYRLQFPAEITPSDQLISRCSREMEKVLLMVFNIWLVRNLMYQVTSTRKKHKVGDHLWTDVDPEEEEAHQQGISEYLSKLHTYLLALAIAGIGAAPGAPAASSETLGADTTHYVKVPLDVVLAYYYRSARVADLWPHGERLGRIQRLCCEERAEWVTLFRAGRLTLGQVIRQVMQKRDAHWVGPLHITRTLPVSLKPAASRTSGTDAPTSGGQESPPGKLQLTMKDGTKLCQAFNSGKGCKNNRCRIEHRCGRLLKNGTVCGSRQHGFSTCPAKKA